VLRFSSRFGKQDYQECAKLSERDLLLSFGYKPEHLIEHEDGSVTLNSDALILERVQRRIG
jgi:hypothetical protein